MRRAPLRADEVREEEEAQQSDMQFSREAEGRTRKRNERS